MWPLFLLLFFVQLAWTQQCNVLFGPSGTTACVNITGYDQYQWATCLTNSYIKQKSFHRHACVYQFAIYCWYQCMVEVHSQNSGHVSRDCSCTPSSNPSRPTPRPTASLPSWCLSPSGANCFWYRSCLERKYRCRDRNNADAMRFAEEVCWLYNNRRSTFSLDERKWVDGVRKCLQVSLVPLLRPWNKPTCQKIRQSAFESHASCYKKPDRGVPSICDLDCKQYLKIFWAIKGSFFQVDKVWKSLSGLWNIHSECRSNSSRNCFEEGSGQGLIKITKILIKKFNRRGKRSFDSTPEEDARHRFTDRVASAISRGLKWDTVVIDWYTYLGVSATNASDPTSLEIIMVLADKKALGLVTTFRPSVNFNVVLQRFSSSIEGGTLPLQVDGYNVWVKSLSSCTDKSCNGTQILADSEKPPIWPVPTTPQATDKPSDSTSGITSGISTDISPTQIFIPEDSPTGKNAIIHKPSKKNDGASIFIWNAKMCGVAAFVIMLIN